MADEIGMRVKSIMLPFDVEQITVQLKSPYEHEFLGTIQAMLETYPEKQKEISDLYMFIKAQRNKEKK